MGVFFHPITLIGPTGARETVEGMVDTGAMFTVIPAGVLERLGVQPFDTIPVRFANGQIQRWPIGEVQAGLDGQRRPILCLFGSPDAPPLIGAHTLEAFLLTVDPVEQKLVPKEALLMTVNIVECWVYENWRAAPGGKARIHMGSCVFCNHGMGTGRGETGRNGKWHGPYSSRQSAEAAAKALGRPLTDHCRICS